MRFSHAPGLNSVVSADLATYRFGFSTGAGGEAILGSHLELAWIPQLAAPAVDSVALGYASDFGGLRLGLLGTLPTTQATSDPTLESSRLGTRRALGVIAQRRAGGTTYGASLAFAGGFERPIGIATSGAFGVDDSSAISSGTFVQHCVGGKTVVEASMEVARHRPEANAALTTPDYVVRSASFGARTALGTRTMLSAELKRAWSGSEAVRLHVPLTINENGDIGRMTYKLPYDDLVGRTALTLRLDHALAPQVDLRLGLTRERDGFGISVTGIAAVVEIVN